MAYLARPVGSLILGHLGDTIGRKRVLSITLRSILASAIFIPVASMSTGASLSWGWRVPFLLSAVVVAVGVAIRRGLPESPAFEEEQEHHDVPKAPLAAVLRHCTADVLKVIFAGLGTVNATIFGIYALTYGVNTMHLPRTALPSLLILVNLIALVTIPAAGMLADRFGRKPVYVIGILGTAVMIWPFIWALSERNLVLAYVFGIVMVAIFLSGYGGAALASWPEQLDTRVRMSGVAVGTQFGFALGGLAPAIAAAHQLIRSDGWRGSLPTTFRDQCPRGARVVVAVAILGT